MEEIRLTLLVTGPDPEDLDDLDGVARSLRSDLQEISDIRVSEVLTTRGQEGTRSGIVTEYIAGGGLGIIITYQVSTVVRDIVKTIQNWQNRNEKNRLIMKEMDGSSVELHGLSEEGALRVLETRKGTQQTKTIGNE